MFKQHVNLLIWTWIFVHLTTGVNSYTIYARIYDHTPSLLTDWYMITLCSVLAILYMIMLCIALAGLYMITICSGMTMLCFVLRWFIFKSLSVQCLITLSSMLAALYMIALCSVLAGLYNHALLCASKFTYDHALFCASWFISYDQDQSVIIYKPTSTGQNVVIWN